MAGKKGQKKRFWSDDEKRSICMQTTVPSVSVAQVARRYAMNANLIHNWLKDLRFASELDVAVSADRVDITLSDGRRILVEGPTALSGVLALVKGLVA